MAEEKEVIKKADAFKIKLVREFGASIREYWKGHFGQNLAKNFIKFQKFIKKGGQDLGPPVILARQNA